MRPIPKRLLPSEVKIARYLGNNGEGVEYDNPATIKNVKIEEKKKYFYSTNGKELIGSAVMFYDLVNSSGLNKQPEVESKVIYGDRTYHIIDVEVLRGDRDEAHHYEILLK
mgnify:CR=1 FL=1